MIAVVVVLGRVEVEIVAWWNTIIGLANIS